MSVNENLKLSRGLALIAGGTLWADCPIGTINAFGGTTAPDGWLLCQGQALSRTEYKDLFDVIGTNFGSGDGSTTFNIPDFRGEFLRGTGNNSHNGQGDGSNIGVHQDATFIPRTATVDSGRIIVYKQPVDWVGPNFYDKETLGNSFYSTTGTVETMTDQSIGGTVRPTNTSVNFIMKAKQTPIPADLKAALEKAVDDKNILSWS